MDEEEAAPKLPAIYHHLLSVYEAMEREAQITEVDGQSVLVYDGHPTKLFGMLHIAMPYYGNIMRIMEQLGCATQIRRGGGKGTSQWALWKKPAEETFLALNPPRSAHDRAPTKVKTMQMEQQIRGILEQLGGLDIVKAFTDLASQQRSQERRIKALEDELATARSVIDA